MNGKTRLLLASHNHRKGEKVKRMIALVTLMVAAAGWSGCQTVKKAPAVSAPPPDHATEQRLEADIRFLADDLLEGRAPGRGLDVAALYLANKMRAVGWRPGNGASYLQPYELSTFSNTETKRVVRINGVELNKSEFILMTIGNPSDVEGRFNLVYAGYGIVSPERGRDDLAGFDVKGKGVVTLFGAPWKLDPNGIHDCDRAVGRALQLGIRGAQVMIYVSPELDSPKDAPASPEIAMMRDMEPMPGNFLPDVSGRAVFPVAPAWLFLKPAAFNRVLASSCGGTFAELSSALATGQPTRPRAVAATVEIGLRAKPVSMKVANVVAKLPGSDPSLSKEWIVLSAHYDHLGMIEAPPRADRIFNGADDNASGVAAVLEITRRLTAGPPLKRSVLALFLSGEEAGLLGSGYYSFHPLVPTAEVVANINLDMVGRSDGSVELISAGSSDLFAAASESSRGLGIQVVPDRNPQKRLIYFVDSYHFARQGVPSLEVFTAMHADYHRPSDEADKIRFDHLAVIVEMTARLVGSYAAGAPRPRYERPAWFSTPEVPAP
jgi:hypothetical protein